MYIGNFPTISQSLNTITFLFIHYFNYIEFIYCFSFVINNLKDEIIS